MKNTIHHHKRFSLASLCKQVSLIGLFCAQSLFQHAYSEEVKIAIDLANPVVLEKIQDKNYLRISLTGFDLKENKRQPINLALVIDRSGSMDGERIEKARDAAILAVNMLNENDTISVIAYDTDAKLVVPSMKVQDKNKIISQIKEEIVAKGSTALFAGVSLGIKEVEKFLSKNQVNRVILLSDGQANVGPDSPKELGELGRLAAKQGIAVTTIGLGEGYNEDLMVTLANYSDGNHAFVRSATDLERAFTREFKDVMSVVAQNVTIQITTDKGVKPIRLLGRDGKIIGNTVEIKLNQLYANQEKYILLEVLPEDGKSDETKSLADVKISYDNVETKKPFNLNEKVNISYTAKKEEVEAKQKADVIVDKAMQMSNENTQEALKLLDEGKKEEAQNVLSKNQSLAPAFSGEAFESRKKSASFKIYDKSLVDEYEKNKEVTKKKTTENIYQSSKQQKADNP